MGLRTIIRNTCQKISYWNALAIVSRSENKKLKSFFSQLLPVVTDYPLIRIGADNDGGYLVPDDLEGITRCYSPGVANCSEFELFFASRNIPCHLADFSVENIPIESDMFTFDKLYIGPWTKDNFISLNDWILRHAQNEYGGDYILQMDIEGSEYSSLLTISEENLSKFRIIVLELHDLHAVIADRSLEFISEILTKILRQFNLVHTHINNCGRLLKYMDVTIPSVIEVTFIRKDRSASYGHVKALPHKLDMPCCINRKELSLTEILFK